MTDPQQPVPEQPADPSSPSESPAPEPQPKRRRSVSLITAVLIAGGVGLVACIGGVAAGGGNSTPAIKYSASPYPVVTTVIETRTVEASPPAPTTPAAPPAAVIGEGSWTVGTDFPPGVYRAVGAGNTCYWGIYKAGTNQATIVANHNGGGNLTVTLAVGQEFTSERCGTWTKVD